MGAKKLRKITTPVLKHINGEQIKFLAEQSGFDDSYIWMIAKGKRGNRSAKARVIYKAAKVLNKAIENGQQKAKDLIIIGEND